MTALRDLAGQRFGRLTVVGRTIGKSPRVRWDVQCDCGTLKSVGGNNLARIASCGCRRKERRAKIRVAAPSVRGNTRHGGCAGGKSTPEYAVWSEMRARCRRKSHHAFAQYGGRGIKVCERWADFATFLSDMGPRPSLAHSIDRFPDNDGNYEPGNCRWATQKEQMRNRRCARMVEVEGVPTCLSEACERLGLNYGMTLDRMRRGWSFEESSSIPRGQRKGRAA